VQGNDAGRSRRWLWRNVVAVVREGKGNVSLPWRSGEDVLGLVLISAPGRGLQPRLNWSHDWLGAWLGSPGLR
jgi:hypothetical protein